MTYPAEEWESPWNPANAVEVFQKPGKVAGIVA
jgi:hypothetical protein